jgi:hypothetical protein
MSWLSSWLDKQGKAGQTLNAVAKPVQKIANPILNNIPVVGQIKQGLELVGDYVPGAPKGASAPALPLSGLTAADWLKAIFGGIGGALDYKQGQSKQEESVNRYARDTATKEGQIAVGAQDRINRAPLADQAQFLSLARMKAAPTTFAPRDFTRQGMSQATMQAPAQGGPQDALAAARTAAGSYQPGQGGVDTSVLELLKKRMLANSGMAG